MENKNWPDAVRLKMIERSEFHEPNGRIYQYGYYDGYQHAEPWELQQRIEKLEAALRELVELRKENVGLRLTLDGEMNHGKVLEYNLQQYRGALRELVELKDGEVTRESAMRLDDYYGYLRKLEDAWEAARELVNPLPENKK